MKGEKEIRKEGKKENHKKEKDTRQERHMKDALRYEERKDTMEDRRNEGKV